GPGEDLVDGEVRRLRGRGHLGFPGRTPSGGAGSGRSGLGHGSWDGWGRDCGHRLQRGYPPEPIRTITLRERLHVTRRKSAGSGGRPEDDLGRVQLVLLRRPAALEEVDEHPRALAAQGP